MPLTSLCLPPTPTSHPSLCGSRANTGTMHIGRRGRAVTSFLSPPLFLSTYLWIQSLICGSQIEFTQMPKCLLIDKGSRERQAKGEIYNSIQAKWLDSNTAEGWIGVVVMGRSGYTIVVDVFFLYVCMYNLCVCIMLIACQKRKLVSCSRCAGNNRETDREKQTDIMCVGLVYLCDHTVYACLWLW